MLLQWAVGGMAFCWFTTRRREVGLGYGWLLRSVYAVIALGAVRRRGARRSQPGARGCGRRHCGGVPARARDLRATAGRRRARAARGARPSNSPRVAAMTGIERGTGAPVGAGDRSRRAGRGVQPVARPRCRWRSARSACSPPPSTPTARSPCRRCGHWSVPPSSGAITDAMLLGHWYLVQPGLPRRQLHELVDAVAIIWPDRGARPAHPDRHGERVVGRRRRRVGRDARLDVGGVCRDDDRAGVGDEGGAARDGSTRR